jgi:hypothetical protein
MWRNRNYNREGKQMSTTKEIDLGALSPEHLKNVQEVYKIMALLLDEDANYEALTTEQYDLINTACTSIKIRDGVLKYFGDAAFDVRVDIMKSFTIISQVIFDRVDTDNEEEDTEPLGNITMMIAAMMLCHAGILSDFDEDRDVEYELALVDKLLNEAEALGCQASLLSLLQLARRHDIPPIVFYQSLVAVSFHKVTDPTGHLDG